jgi:hypothetical protein
MGGSDNVVVPTILGEGPTMPDLSDQQRQLREKFVIALIEATYPLQQGSKDREITLELLIQAADQLKEHLESELEELREEAD